jgi:hypothetical protein
MPMVIQWAVNKLICMKILGTIVEEHMAAVNQIFALVFWQSLLQMSMVQRLKNDTKTDMKICIILL